MRQSRKFAPYQRHVTRTLSIDGFEVKPYFARQIQSEGWYYKEDKHGTATLDRTFYYISKKKARGGIGFDYPDTLCLWYNKNGWWVFRNLQSGICFDETPYKNPVKPPLMWALQMLDVMGTGE